MKFTKLSILLALATLLALNGCQPANGSNPSNQTTKGLPTLAENQAWDDENLIDNDTSKVRVCFGVVHLDGTNTRPCKATPQKGSNYCYAHDISKAVFHCAAETKAGNPCKMRVKINGEFCHIHKVKN